VAGRPKRKAQRAKEAAEKAAAALAPPSAGAREASDERNDDERSNDAIIAANQRKLLLEVEVRLDQPRQLSSSDIYNLHRVLDGETRRGLPRGAKGKPTRLRIITVGDEPAAAPARKRDAPRKPRGKRKS
jgi:hypothetical protein